MNETQKSVLLHFFQAVGQPERLKILGLLANQPYGVADLALLLSLREKRVSQHLSKLRKMKLVRMEQTAVSATYHFNEQALAFLHDTILTEAAADDAG